MFKIDPNTLYTKQDIQRVLGDDLTMETFLSRLQPRKVFKNLYRGQDLLDVWERCLSENTHEPLFLKERRLKRKSKDKQQMNRINLDGVLREP